jgi:uncharacterized membrane protein YgdD (TMEM256/DUF423 family)
MNYHRRYHEDGSCEVICTRCFLTLGLAKQHRAAQEIETQHVCGRTTGKELSRIHANAERLVFVIPGRLRQLNIALLLLIVGVVLYALPTMVELAAAEHVSPWVATVLFGDFTGCACLAAVFKMRRTGLLFYLLLTGCEGALYASHTLSANALVWLVDLVPTLVVAGKIARLRSADDRMARGEAWSNRKTVHRQNRDATVGI